MGVLETAFLQGNCTKNATIRAMKRLLPLTTVCFLLSSALVEAEDLSNRFGIAGIVGAAFPVAPDYVTSNTSSVGLDIGFVGSFYVSPYIGMGLSYESIHLGDGQWVSPIDILFLYRFHSDKNWTPTFQFGAGSAKGVNSDRMENLNFKTGLGVDWFVSPSVAVGPQINYFFISHSGDASTEVHLVTTNILVSYYFGSTYSKN